MAEYNKLILLIFLLIIYCLMTSLCAQNKEVQSNVKRPQLPTAQQSVIKQKQQAKKPVKKTDDSAKILPLHVTSQEARRLDVMVPLAGGDFLMGVRDLTSRTGEHPLRHVSVRPFKIDKYPVTNANFERFLTMKSKYVTTAEVQGWSWVFFSRAPKEIIKNNSLFQTDDPWWFKMPLASWKMVNDKESKENRPLNPAVHLSYYDASAFCYAVGKRLPTEYEWEFAARGGLIGMRYPWGEQWKKNRTNVWQGLFPQENKKLDGFDGISPVNAFPPQNNYGLYDMIGNVWEWTSTIFKTNHMSDGNRIRDKNHRPQYVVKGGSFVDSRDGSSNLEARCAARRGLSPEYTAENVGFRCVQSLEGSKVIAKAPNEPRPPRINKLDEKGRQPRVHRVEETWSYKVKKVISNFFMPQSLPMPNNAWSMRREEL